MESGEQLTTSDTLPRRAAVICGLTAVAVTQPILDLLGRNAEFFVAGNYDRAQIITLALVVALVPGAVMVTGVALLSLVHRRVADVAYSLAVAVLAGLFALVVMRNIGIDRVLATVFVAVLVGAATAVAERHIGAARSFLSYMFLSNLIFLASFLLFSRSSDLVLASGAMPGVGEVAVPPLRGPVVVIVLDEFPLATLLRADGTINEDRFPNFARLAEMSTWFRNASSLEPKTQRAVPQMLTGQRLTGDELPTFEDLPRNLLTLIGSKYPVQRYEIVTDLCPPTMCEASPRSSLHTALRDTATVYGHLALPAPFRARLPPIDHSWGGFDESLAIPDEGADDDIEHRAYAKWRGLGEMRGARLQAEVLHQMSSQVDGSPAVHFIHVALPHYKWILGPGGLETLDFPPVKNPGVPEYAERRLLGHQLHVMQVGATDRAIGEVIDDLRRRDVWDDALVAILSDHGTGLIGPDFGRDVTPANREEVLRVPMFIKAPGQEQGQIRDDVALTIDLVPSIVDILDVRTDWEFDGHSLFDGSDPTVEPRVSPDVKAVFRVARDRAADFPYGDDWDAVAAVGELGYLVGSSVDMFEDGEPSDLAWRLKRREELADLPTAEGRLPIVLVGSITGDSSGDEPPELVVALNGRVAGVVHSYTRGDHRAWRFETYLADHFVDGENDIAAFEVEDTPGGPVLHRVRDAPS